MRRPRGPQGPGSPPCPSAGPWRPGCRPGAPFRPGTWLRSARRDRSASLSAPGPPAAAEKPASPGMPAAPGTLAARGSPPRLRAGPRRRCAVAGRGAAASPVPALLRPGAAGHGAEVGHHARHLHHALRAEAPRPACRAHHPGRTLPRRRALARSVPGRMAVDGCQGRPGHGCATRPRLALRHDPGRLRIGRPARRGTVGRTVSGAHRAEKLAVVDEASHALRGQRAGEGVRVDGQVRRGIPADRAERSGRVAGDHFDVAVEHHPVAGLRVVAVAQRVPAVMSLGVLHDRDDLRRVRIGVDAYVRPRAQRPRICRPPGDPALLPGSLSAHREREAGEGGAGLAVVRAVHAVDSPDERLHLGRALRLRHAEVVLRYLDDGRPQRAVARLLGLGRLGGLVEGHQLHRHPGRRRHLVDRSVGEGEPGHRTARAEADQRGCLLPGRLRPGHPITFFLVCVRAG